MSTLQHLRAGLALVMLASTLAACGGGDDKTAARAGASAALDDTLATALAQNPTGPGIAARVEVESTGLDWMAGAGYADVVAGRPLTVEATFRIASVTKT